MITIGLLLQIPNTLWVSRWKWCPGKEMDQWIIHLQTTIAPLDHPRSTRCLRLLVIDPEQGLPLGQLVLPASSDLHPPTANSHDDSHAKQPQCPAFTGVLDHEVEVSTPHGLTMG